MVLEDHERCQLQRAELDTCPHFPGLHGPSMSTWVTAPLLFSLVSRPQDLLRGFTGQNGRSRGGTLLAVLRERYSPWHPPWTRPAQSLGSAGARGLEAIRGGGSTQKTMTCGQPQCPEWHTEGGR